MRLDALPQLFEWCPDSRLEPKVRNELVKVLVWCCDLVQVQSARDLTNQPREVFFCDLKGLGHIGNLTRELFLASDEVGARRAHTCDGAAGDEPFRGQATVEASSFLLQRCGQPRAVTDELICFDEVSFSALACFGSLVDDPASSPVPASLRTHAVTAGNAGVEVANVNGGVQALVGEGVGHRATDS